MVARRGACGTEDQTHTALGQTWQPAVRTNQRTKSAWIFRAVCPAKGKSAGLVMPRCSVAAMQEHLEEISQAGAEGAHAVIIMDQAGWHTAGTLKVPNNITLIALPPRCPELNPVENIWQFIRENWLSNKIFTSYENILEHCCEAWNRLIEQPWKIMSIAYRQWAHAC